MTRQLTAWALAALPAAACLSTPSYQPQLKVSYTEDGTGPTAGATVAGPSFALHFAAGTGFHFPDKLTIGDADVLGHDAAAACFDPNEAGIQLSPSSRISGDSVAMVADPMVKNELRPVLRGPAAVQVRLDWATPLCGAMRRPAGTSTFTVFLDGRIVRHDRVDDSTTTVVNAIDCKCDPGATTEFSVSSYWTFDRAAFSSPASPEPAVYTSPDSDAQDLTQVTPTLPPEINGQEFACFEGTAFQVASASLPSTTDPHFFLFRDDPTLFTFIQYSVVADQDFHGFPWENHSAVFVERSSCNKAFDRAAEFLAPSPLTINEMPVMPSGNDGIYGGDRGDGSAPGLALDSDRARISGKVASSFAVWLSFPHAVDLLRATREGTPPPTGAWYVPQQVDSRTWIVWFRDPLADTQTIVIEPN